MSDNTGITGSNGNPTMPRRGPVSPQGLEGLARNLGWLSIGLGVTELLGAGLLARTLGLRGSENLIRGFGVREITSGVLSLSVDKEIGMWSRVVGDGLDVAALATGLTPDNPKRARVGAALLAIVGIALIDVFAATGVTATNHPQATRRLST